jgi:hypothetical protein
VELLKKEYKKYELIHNSWKNGLFWALFILLIFILFQPFGFRDKDLDLKLFLFPLYSLLAFLYSSSTIIIIRYILKKKRLWTLKDEILYYVIGMFPVTFLVHLLTYLVTGDMPFNLYWYFKLLYHISSLFLIIAVVEFLYYSNKSSGIKIEHLASQVQFVSRQLESIKQEPDFETVSIILEKGSIDINRNKMIFIKSVGNYLEFYFRESNGQIQKLVKRGRIHLAEKDLETIPEFLRCHRAYIINLKQAKQIKGSSKNARLVFDQKLEEIPVSRSQFKTLKEKLDKIISG